MYSVKVFQLSEVQTLPKIDFGKVYIKTTYTILFNFLVKKAIFKAFLLFLEDNMGAYSTLTNKATSRETKNCGAMPIKKSSLMMKYLKQTMNVLVILDKQVIVTRNSLLTRTSQRL